MFYANLSNDNKKGGDSALKVKNLKWKRQNKQLTKNISTLWIQILIRMNLKYVKAFPASLVSENKLITCISLLHMGFRNWVSCKFYTFQNYVHSTNGKSL